MGMAANLGLRLFTRRRGTLELGSPVAMTRRYALAPRVSAWLSSQLILQRIRHRHRDAAGQARQLRYCASRGRWTGEDFGSAVALALPPARGRLAIWV